MSKFVVTGASGYLGRYVVMHLANDGQTVFALVRDSSSVDFPQNVEVVEGDIWRTNEAELSKIVAGATLVHLAWQDGFVHSSNRHMGELSNHFVFLEKAISLGVTKIVGLGSMHELGPISGPVAEDVIPQPRNQYGIAKNALRMSLDELCSRRGIDFLWLRCFYILGDDSRNNSVFSKMLELEAAGAESMPLTSGSTQFDFIDVSELGQLIQRAVKQNGLTGVLNLGSGRVMTLRERIDQFKVDNNLNLKLNFGEFPERAGIGEGCWPDLTKFNLNVDAIELGN